MPRSFYVLLYCFSWANYYRPDYKDCGPFNHEPWTNNTYHRRLVQY